MCESFGRLKGDARIAPGTPGGAYIDESVLGRIIVREILNLQGHFPILKVYQFIVMPDHVHILLRIMEWSEYHLDYYIEALVRNISAIFSKRIGRQTSVSDIFIPGYCDKPLLRNRSLDGLFRYIRENPHRLAIRRLYPQFFQPTRKLIINGKEYEAYGNLFLFRNPDKAAVQISSRFTPEEREAKRQEWLDAASKGTVLVSPFISAAEKGIRKEAEDMGASVILIVHEALSERFKPAAHEFSLCAQGRLLIISAGYQAGTVLSRTICCGMNSLAARMVE